jgi:hypothetical protein
MELLERQVKAYALWLQSRGLRFPVLRETAAGADEPVADAAVAVAADGCSVCDGIDTLPVEHGGRARLDVFFAGDAAFAADEAELLERMIAAMKLGAGRTLSVAMCRRHLEAAVAAAEPRIIVALGERALQTIVAADATLAGARGRFHRVVVGASVEVLATYHPRDLLRTPADKRQAWIDLQLVMERLAR